MVLSQPRLGLIRHPIVDKQALTRSRRQALQKMGPFPACKMHKMSAFLARMADYLPRTIDRELQEWSDSPSRKPLILRGARQTGKSSSVRHLGETGFDLFLEVNLERRSDLRSR